MLTILFNKFQLILQTKWFFPVFIGILTIIVLLLNFQTLTQVNSIRPYRQKYDQSQYVLGDAHTVEISDSDLYIYASFVYWTGVNPATINFEHPPLGKYFFGLSYYLFANPYTLNLVIVYLILFFTYLLFKRLRVTPWWTLGSILFLTFLGALIPQSTNALLDLPLLLASLIFFNCLFLPQENWQKYLCIGLSLGLISGLKYFFPLLFLYLLLLFIWVVKKRTYSKGITSIVIMMLLYLLSYTFFFLDGKNIIDFLHFEFYRFHWWTGERTIPRFLIFQTLFTGSYWSWWTDQPTKVANNFWNISWPILFITQLLSKIWLILRKQMTLPLWLCLIYSGLLLVMYALGSASVDRYLIQLLPFWLLFCGVVINKLKI